MPSKLRPHFVRGVLFALIGGICWAFSGTTAEFLFDTQHVSPSWVTSIRVLVSGVLFFLIALIADRHRLVAAFKDRRAWGAFTLNGLLGIVFCQFTYLTSISYSNSGTTTVLSMVGLALVMGYSCRSSHRFPRKREMFGLVLTLAGVVLIATHGDVTSLAMPVPALVWGLLSAVGLAAYNLIPLRLIGRFGSLVTMAFSMIIAGVCMCVVEQPWTVQVDVNSTVLLCMSAIILVGTIAAAWIYMQAIADIGPVRASMIAAVEPVAATIFTVVFLGTRFELVDLVGFACIVVMVVLVSSKPDDEIELAHSLPKRSVERIAADGQAPDLESSDAAGRKQPEQEPQLEPEKTVLWDSEISKRAQQRKQEKAASDVLSLEEMCSPEAAHLVEVKSQTKDSVRHGLKERIALVAFCIMVVGGFAALTTYITAGHSLNYVSTGIDDSAGDMAGYGVLLFAGTVESPSASTYSASSASSASAASETSAGGASSTASTKASVSSAEGNGSGNETSQSSSASDESANSSEADSATLADGSSSDATGEAAEEPTAGQTVKMLVKKALGLDAPAEDEVETQTSATRTSAAASGVQRETMTVDEAKQNYTNKGASVLEIDVEDRDQYKNGRIIMTGGHTYGILSLTDEEIAALHLPKVRATTTTTTTTQGAGADSTTTTTRSKNVYTSFSDLLASVDADYIDSSLVGRVGDIVKHFRDSGVDIVVAITTDPRPFAAIDGVDVVITVRSSDRFAQSEVVSGTLYVDTPETDSVGALLVAPGNVISSRVLTGETTSAGTKTSSASSSASNDASSDEDPTSSSASSTGDGDSAAQQASAGS